MKKIGELLQQGEGLKVEFKESCYQLNRNVFETVCAFLNRSGGYLLLGISDDGLIKGIDGNSKQKLLDNLVTGANNPQQLNPPYYLSPEVFNIQGRKIICCYVPESSQVHRSRGKIYDRNEDGDFDITDHAEQVAQLYLRKQSTYSENKIYPYIALSDFNEALFPRIRQLAKSDRPDHPWLGMNNEELLRSSGLFKKDYQTGVEGFTLAAVLLMGKSNVIQNVLPFYKTDAIFRAENTDRYDDRDVIRTNLIESYDRLMTFTQKHLSDKFYQEGGQRIDLRNHIFAKL